MPSILQDFPLASWFLDKDNFEIIIRGMLIILGPASGAVGTKLYAAYQRRQNFFRPELEGSFNIITSSNDRSKHSDSPRVHDYGDPVALAIIAKHRTFEWRHYYPETFPNDRIAENLIVIGGEVANPYTKAILENLNSPLRFEGYDIVDSQTGKRYSPEGYYSEKPSLLRRDYGIIIKAPNPRNPRNVVYVFAGCHPDGTVAATDTVYRENALKILAKTKGVNAFAVLVETKLEFFDLRRKDYFQSKPRILAVHRLKY